MQRKHILLVAQQQRRMFNLLQPLHFLADPRFTQKFPRDLFRAARLIPRLPRGRRTIEGLDVMQTEGLLFLGKLLCLIHGLHYLSERLFRNVTFLFRVS